MSPRFQVVLDVRSQGAAQSALIGDDDVIKTLSTNRPDETFHVGVLPRRAWSREDFLHAERGSHGRPSIERGITVAEHVSRRLVPGKRFAELLRHPRGRRVIGDRHVDDAAALVRENHEHEQEPAGGRRDDKEIGGGDLLDMVGEKRAPRLRRRRGWPRHVLRNRCLRDVDPELQELAVNPWCAPERILLRHRLNEAAHIGGDRRTSIASPTFPRPEQPDALAMPRDDRFRFHDDESRSPVAPRC